MRNFEPWPSIDYLPDCRFTVTEKLDGSNVCISIDRDGYQLYTRRGKDALEEIPTVKKHQKIFEPVIKAFQDILENGQSSFLKKWVAADAVPEYFNIYGEFLSSLNLNRIRYAPAKIALYKIFGISVGISSNEQQQSLKLPFEAVENLLTQLHLENYLVPIFERHVPFTELLEAAKIHTKSLLCDHSPEGWVFHPEGAGGKIYKLKTPEFLEKLVDENVSRNWNADEDAEFEKIYSGYFTVNRAFSVLSKFGEITAENLSEAITSYLEDVRTDFQKDYPLLKSYLLSKQAFRINRQAFALLSGLVKPK